MTIKIYHFPKGLTGELICTREDKLLRFAKRHWREYKLVAIVDTDDFNVAWLTTQSNSGPWWERAKTNKTLKINAVDGSRDTKIGDVFMRNNKKYVVTDRGFPEVEEIII